MKEETTITTVTPPESSVRTIVSIGDEIIAEGSGVGGTGVSTTIVKDTLVIDF